MNISDTLKAAFANIDRLEAESKANDKPTEQVTEQVTDADVEDIFAEVPAEETVDDTNYADIEIDEDDEDDTSADTWTSVADAAAPLVQNTIKVKGLDEKAVLVSVKRRMYSPYKLDAAESHAYGAGNVNKHLFTGRDNRVKAALAAYTEVYAFVKDNTVPWTTGVDMLNIEHYFDFTTGLRNRIDEADKSVADLVANWSYEVQEDLNRLTQIANTKGKPNLVNPDDYPTADEVAAKFGIEVRYMPVPTTGDFRVAISDEDKASLQKQLTDAEDNAARHVIEQMLEPMQRAAEKLATPIGHDGSIFRDSLIDNMVDVARRMERVNVSADPVIVEKIKDLRSLVGAYANNKDVLRNSQAVRAKASSQISDLMGTMRGLV